MRAPPIYFTTSPIRCTCGAWPPPLALIHDAQCPVRCPHIASANRHGKPATSNEGDRVPLEDVRCARDRDHGDDHAGFMLRGGHTVRWEDHESTRIVALIVGNPVRRRG